MKDAQPRTIYLKDYQPPSFLIPETKLEVDLRDDYAEVTATLNIRRNPARLDGAADLHLDGEELELVSIQLNGEPLKPNQYSLTPTELIILNVPDTFELKTTCRIQPQNNTRLEGLYRSGGLYCTQCEAEGFRRITWFLDRPDVLSIYTTRIEADKSQCPVLLSNGNPVSAGQIDAQRHTATWHDPFPKPSYLFALVAGRLEAVSDTFTTASGRKVKLNIYVEPHNLDKCDFAMGALKRAMRWDEERYGREYDLDLFNIVAVDDFNMGAMENKGLNIFNASCVLARQDTTTDEGFERIEAIVAHEYFHNWSGNRVTCRDWFQLSLKEGLTVYRDACFTADMHSPTVKRIDDVNLLRSAQFAEDSGPMAHPVRPDSYIEISNFYTLTVYEKGAEVVRMLNTLLGDALFRQGTDLYFERHDGQAVTTDDFVKAMEDVSGRDLTQFRRWYTQAGTPVLDIQDAWSAETGTWTLHISQSCPPTPGQPEKAPFHMPFKVGLLDVSGRPLPLNERGETEIVLELTEAQQTFSFTGLPSRPIPSLNRGFSAPIRLNYDYTHEQLSLLVQYDTDGFNRWDAMQSLASRTIHAHLLDHHDAQELLNTLASTLAICLDRADEDRALAARLLQLPSVSWLRDQWQPCDIQALISVYDRIETELAHRLAQRLEQTWRRLSEHVPEDLSSAGIAGRALKNQCLRWLSLHDADCLTTLAQAQLRGARTMSSRLGALQALLRTGPRAPVKEAVEASYNEWKDDRQAMEIWMSMQACEARWADLEKVKALTLHPLFSETHPNSVRAVIGRFSNANWHHFHAADGSGYFWLADWVIRLDAINPQIAARIATPLTQWAKYIPQQGHRMRTELERILSRPGLSRDVYEIVKKSLTEQ